MSVIVQVSVTVTPEHLKQIGQVTIQRVNIQEGGKDKYVVYWDGELVAFLYHNRSNHYSSLVAEAMQLVTLRVAEKKLERIAAHPSSSPH